MAQTRIYIRPKVQVSGILTCAATSAPATYCSLLTDRRGEPRPDGTYKMTLRLYDAPWGGRMLWSECHEVEIGFGVFCVDLGLPFPFAFPLDAKYWLSIQVDEESELTKRLPFGLVRCEEARACVA